MIVYNSILWTFYHESLMFKYAKLTIFIYIIGIGKPVFLWYLYHVGVLISCICVVLLVISSYKTARCNSNLIKGFNGLFIFVTSTCQSCIWICLCHGIKQENSTIPVEHHYMQANTNNVDKICAFLQTTGVKDETNITRNLSNKYYREWVSDTTTWTRYYCALTSI
jgi:hypothetical protein